MNENININVSGPNQPTSIYKTVILKGNKSFASQVTEPNTKYVIKHNFVLDDDVTIPENCVLEFDGGSINGNETALNVSRTKIYPNFNTIMDGKSVAFTVNGMPAAGTFYWQNGKPTWSDGEKWIYADGTSV